MMRVGQGFDIHRLQPGDGFHLGGYFIESSFSIVAHSDGDVLLHALCDALLGALALGDIGQHFPDTDAIHKQRASADFVTAVMAMVKARGYRLMNLDATVRLEKPKLRGYMAAIRANIASLLAVGEGQVSVKATTMEQLDAVGQGKAIAAEVVVLMVAENKQ